MAKKTNEMVTINDAMVQAIAQAVTSAVTTAITSALATSASDDDAQAVKASTTGKGSKGASPKAKARKAGAGCVGYIEKNGKPVYIAKVDRNGNAWVAKTDKAGAIVLDDNGKAQTLYDAEKYATAKAKAIKAGKYNPKKRGDVYKSLKWVVTGKVVKL